MQAICILSHKAGCWIDTSARKLNVGKLRSDTPRTGTRFGSSPNKWTDDIREMRKSVNGDPWCEFFLAVSAALVPRRRFSILLTEWRKEKTKDWKNIWITDFEKQMNELYKFEIWILTQRRDILDQSGRYVRQFYM